MDRHWTIEELRKQAARLPRASLTTLPTPLDDCPRLGKELGVRLFMKRDDLTTLGGGGNKLRKLEFSLGEALATGCDVLVHGLAGQSNYCRQAAAAAAKMGLRCVLVLRSDHKTEDPAQGNRLLDYIFGAEVRMVPADPKQQGPVKAAVIEQLKAAGHKPYVIGQHDEVLGAVSYALCMAEIVEQTARAGVRPDCVCVSGRAGTQAGLVLGKRLLGLEAPVLGYNVAPIPDQRASDELTAQIATEAAGLLGAELTVTADDIVNTDRYGGPSYGMPSEECLEAMLLLGRTEGVLVGPVYTAKGLSGVIGEIRAGRIPPGSTVVFVHTGGLPETYAYNAEIMERVNRSAAPVSLRA